MELELMINDGNTELKLIKILAEIDSSFLYFNQHGLRHPLGIFNISKAQFLRNLENILEEIEKGVPDNLSVLHRTLVESYIASFEDFYSILLCFFDISEINGKKKFIHDKLKKVIPGEIERLNDNLKPLRSKYALINNAVKHNHARYNILKMKSIYGTVYGYFIDSIENEVVMPNKEIHPVYQNTDTGISYHYDLKRIITYWLKAVEYFTNEVEILIANKKINIIQAELPEDKSNLIDIVKRIGKLKEYYFIDEYQVGVAKFRFSDDLVKIVYPASKKYGKNLFFPQHYQMTLSTNGDGVTRTWSIPYMGG